MKRIVSIVLVIILLVCTGNALADSDRKKSSDTILDYAVGMLGTIQTVYSFSGTLDDIEIRLAYGYLMMFKGAYITSRAESMYSMASFGGSDDMYQLRCSEDLLIIYMEGIIEQAESAWSAYQNGETDRDDLLTKIMDSIQRAVNIYNNAKQYVEEKKAK